jgi:hypothetical protein
MKMLRKPFRGYWTKNGDIPSTWQQHSALCINRREITHTCLEMVARAGNPYSLLAIFV